MPAPAADSPPLPVRLEALTILRFFAALWVVTLHLQSHAPLPVFPLAQRLFQNGAHAMTLFFVLSGTVLAYGYHRLRPTAPDVIAFYQNRFARIYAPYALLHVVALVFFAPANAAEFTRAAYTNVLSFLGLQAWFPHAVGVGANTGTWSISAEFFFYALFPALLPLVAWLRRKHGALRVGAYLAALSGFIGFADFIYPNGFIYYALPAARLPEFMLGIVVGLSLLEPARHPGRTGPVLAGAGVVAAACAVNPVMDYGLWIRAHLVVVPAFAWLIYALARWDQYRAPGRGLVWRVSVYFGESSYALFLVHLLPVLFLGSDTGRAWVHRSGPSLPGLLWLAVIALSLLGAVALHEGVEKPVRRALLRRWRPAAG